MRQQPPPGQWDADVVLADGTIAAVRPVEPADRERFIRFYEQVSPESKYLRFFAAHPTLTDDDLDAWVDVDHRDRVTLVLVQEGEIVATARYAVVPALLPERVGDVSFLVQDDHQGRGAANILLEHLAQVGRESGVDRFFAEMLTANQSMKQVFVRAGYDVRPSLEDGYVTVDFAIAPTERSRSVMLEREHRSEATSIRRLLSPESVAVVGHTGRMDTIVSAVMAGGYRGRLQVVTDAGGRSPAVNLAALADAVDLVVTEYHPERMNEIIDAAADRGAHGMIVLARGRNPNLSDAEAADFIRHARSRGLRALGPASLGMINHDPQVRLNASPAPRLAAGPIGLFTQSAGISTLTLSRAVERRCGMSTFLASGAFADITANDVMQFWSVDEATGICLLSLDAVGNPRKFFRVLRRLALDKPVVIFAPSRGLQSARRSGTEGLPAAPARALDEVIGATGTMVVTRRDTMFDIAQILARQPVMAGRRVTVISNSAGLTEQMVQSARRFGLIPEPVIVSGEPVPGILAAAEMALGSHTADAVVAAVVEISDPILPGVRDGLRTLARDAPVPLVAVPIGLRPPPDASPQGDEPGALPVFGAYADALEALSIIAVNEERRAVARPHPDDEVSGPPESSSLVDDFLAERPEGGWLSDEECTALLAAYGITLIPWWPAATVAEAVDAGAHFGWNVVLKATHPMVRGRPELSTIIRTIPDEHSMSRAWDALAKVAADLGLADTADLFPVVQPAMAAAASVTVRAIEDPVLGPIVSTGVQGAASELLADRSWAVPPVRRVDAHRMLTELAAAPLLSGYRGAPDADLASVEDLLMRVGRLKDDHAAVVDVELSPVITAPDGVSVVGARARLAPLAHERDPLARLL